MSVNQEAVEVEQEEVTQEIVEDVETPESVESAESESQDSETPTESGEADPEQTPWEKLPQYARDTITKLRAKNRELQQLQPQNRQPQQQEYQQPNAPSADSGAPREEDYESFLDYQRDVIRYEARREAERHYQHAQQKIEHQKIETSFAEKVESARTRYSDYDQVMEMSGSIPIPPAASEAIKRAANAGDIVYHLAKNPNEAYALANNGDPYAQIMQVAEIGRKIGTSGKRKTNAPPPVTPVRGAAPKTEQDIAKMTPAQTRDYMWSQQNK